MKTQNKDILASIIIVNYNNAKFLSKSINSAINQSYKSKEIIVVDNNSNDDSLNVLKKFKNKITIIQNKERTSQGSYNQINCYYKGVLKSKGNYLFFLDSDDYYKKNKIKLIMNKFKKNKNLSILFDLPIWKFKSYSFVKIFKQKKFIFSYIPRFSPQSCISIKKKYAVELFKYIMIKKFETIWLDFRIANYTFLKFGNIYIINNYLTYYRQLDNSASKKFSLFSKNWWLRRNQAHDFIIYLKKKFKIKHKNSLDEFLTRIFK